MIATQHTGIFPQAYPTNPSHHPVILVMGGLAYKVIIRTTENGDKIVGAYYPYDAETLRRIQFALNDFLEGEDEE